MVEFYAERTLTPRQSSSAGSARRARPRGQPPLTHIEAHEAVLLGWADFMVPVGSEHLVEGLAAALARGNAVRVTAGRFSRTGRRTPRLLPRSPRLSRPRTCERARSTHATGSQSARPWNESRSGPISDNLWPNPTSEEMPPAGAVTTGPEFGWRHNVGVGNAPSGAWVRRGLAPASTQSIGITAPCAPGARVLRRGARVRDRREHGRWASTSSSRTARGTSSRAAGSMPRRRASYTRRSRFPAPRRQAPCGRGSGCT